MYPYVNSWKDSLVRAGFGGFAVQDIFTPGDPLHPPRKGAVLTYLKQFSHGILYGSAQTEKVRHSDEQAIFYIMRGAGKVEAGADRIEIGEGSGVFVPAGIEYRFVNTAGIPLEAIIIVERAPAGFIPINHIVVKRYREQTPGFCCWAR